MLGLGQVQRVRARLGLIFGMDGTLCKASSGLTFGSLGFAAFLDLTRRCAHDDDGWCGSPFNGRFSVSSS